MIKKRFSCFEFPIHLERVKMIKSLNDRKQKDDLILKHKSPKTIMDKFTSLTSLRSNLNNKQKISELFEHFDFRLFRHFQRVSEFKLNKIWGNWVLRMPTNENYKDRMRSIICFWLGRAIFDINLKIDQFWLLNFKLRLEWFVKNQCTIKFQIWAQESILKM